MPLNRITSLCCLVSLALLGAATPAAVDAANHQRSASPAKAKPKKAADNKPSRRKAAAASPRNDDAPDDVIYGRRDDVRRFGEDIASRQQLDPQWVARMLEQARYLPTVARLMSPPPAGTAKNWAAYRDRFIEPVRVRAGRAFWDANQRWLAAAEARYGVPAEIVVGIIGVETIYGRQMGTFRVIDALATLAFDYPAGRRDRSPFFRDELENYLRWCADQAIDPLAMRGSYAGAMGMPQFMPSSIRKYAVDFDGDGRIDLHNNTADVIGSVANYLAAFGWQPGLATHHQVGAPVDVSDRAALLAPDILPTFTAREFIERGAWLPPAAIEHDGKLALVELQNGSAAASYVAGTSNFYAITRYNWSSYYAMAVIELGQAVKSSR
ncbi:lytic murein transglycosylase B [Piscinibacter sakaiensis]|uniref:lytic murein transglycosylase B n=1 Tax=Piscinibacter sakaiensis TaxID=1547922 RepID=UPI003AAC23E2